MTTWKVKRETANLFQNNNKPQRYLEKFLSNVQLEKQKECGTWLDDGAIMSELKVIKYSNITEDTVYSADIDKAIEFATGKMQAMVFIHYPSLQYDALQRKMENNI